jgi:uncharacterized protein (DUF1697 family)
VESPQARAKNFWAVARTCSGKPDPKGRAQMKMLLHEYFPCKCVISTAKKITMHTHLALLRGINVSGQKLIKMEDLRKLMETAGFENVKTYIQSGNIIFESRESNKAKISAMIKKLISDHYGFDVGILMLNHADLAKAIANNPLLKEKDIDLKQVYVTFLSESPIDEHIEKFKTTNIEKDIAVILGDVMYLKYFVGAGTTKLTNALIENRLKVVATTRNWNTTLKLMELLEQRK